MISNRVTKYGPNYMIRKVLCLVLTSYKLESEVEIGRIIGLVSEALQWSCKDWAYMKVMEQDLKNLLLISCTLFEPPGVPACKTGCGKNSPTIYFHAEELKFKRAEALFLASFTVMEITK